MGKVIHILAFASLGFLIGNLIGMTAESVVSAVLPLLFAFGGGSAIGFLHRLNEDAQRAAGAAILTLSTLCFIGVYTGIVVSEYQLLSRPEQRQLRADATVEENKYLRSFLMNEANRVDQLRATGQITNNEAYNQLYQLLIQPE